MAVQMLSGSGAGAPKKKKMSSLKKPEVSLPTEKTKPPTSISEYSLYIYGQQKIGKTSFTTHFDKALHIMLEPSGKAFSLFEIAPKNWSEFLAYLELLEKKKKKGTLEYKTFIIDTVDLLYTMCSDKVCGDMGIEHPSDANDFGKTWQKVEGEFRKHIVRLASLGGFVALTHEVDKEVQTRNGNKYQSIVPSAQKKCNLILAKFCDLTGNYYINKFGDRVLKITASEEAEAGNRIDTEENPRFRWKGTSTPIKEIPMGSTSTEAFENFSKAFNNELEKKGIKPQATNKTTSRGSVRRASKVKVAGTNTTKKDVTQGDQ